MMRSSSFRRKAALSAALAAIVVAAGCSSTKPAESNAGGDQEIASGTTLPISSCPEDWADDRGIAGDTIKLGWTGPKSGPLAAFGPVGEGIKMYFDHVNETDPIDGKKIELVMRDDAAEPGKAVTNMREMVDSDGIAALVHTIGTPVSKALRDVAAETCVPQLFADTGFPMWGDPKEFPWTIGWYLDYETEARIWCSSIAEDKGKGATVAAVFMNNDFGKTYQSALKKCDADGTIKLVESLVHDPTAPDVSAEMTTMIASKADAFVAGTTSPFCTQTVSAVAGSNWRPAIYMSNACNNLASFFEPVKDDAKKLQDAGAAVRMVNIEKVCGDPAYKDDDAILEMQKILKEQGDVSCADGTYSMGIIYGDVVAQVLRAAAELPGGLTRSNIMKAVWNFDGSSRFHLGGTLKTDGDKDAYLIEAGQVQEVVVKGGELTFASVGDLTDLAGQGGSYDK